jgi:hypothetical protein
MENQDINNKKYNYNCEDCKFYTNAKSAFDNHLRTGKHLTGKRTTRCDKRNFDKCPHCEYKNTNITNMTQHILNNHSTKEERKTKFKFYCEICDYGTFGKSSYKSHLDSEKHKLVESLVSKNKI